MESKLSLCRSILINIVSQSEARAFGCCVAPRLPHGALRLGLRLRLVRRSPALLQPLTCHLGRGLWDDLLPNLLLHLLLELGDLVLHFLRLPCRLQSLLSNKKDVKRSLEQSELGS